MRDALPPAEAVLRQVIGRNLVAVTEARHWSGGRRSGDEESLLHFWLHFQGVPAVMANESGDLLRLQFAEPYAAYDMGEFGETRVGPAQRPDLLALLPGHRLLNAAPIDGGTTQPAGLLLRLGDHE
ncbi:hypothetical protein [Micromonospora sp. AMSO1212t]|uniref:hypothetical protein n=1 Tax=Micromonospora sp. AMSO1212t TaxID=2650565 RepID=UPI001CECDDEE|nr:hypothetical protein [Micromonospora sp. AMSO1212t]